HLSESREARSRRGPVGVHRLREDAPRSQRESRSIHVQDHVDQQAVSRIGKTQTIIERTRILYGFKAIYRETYPPAYPGVVRGGNGGVRHSPTRTGRPCESDPRPARPDPAGRPAPTRTRSERPDLGAVRSISCEHGAVRLRPILSDSAGNPGLGGARRPSAGDDRTRAVRAGACDRLRTPARRDSGGQTGLADRPHYPCRRAVRDFDTDLLERSISYPPVCDVSRLAADQWTDREHVLFAQPLGAVRYTAPAHRDGDGRYVHPRYGS